MTSPLRTSFSSICIQQKLSGTGYFDGSILGYARYLFSVAGTELRAAALQAGTEGNALEIEMLDLNPTVIPITIVQHPSAVRTQVILRTDGVNVLSTADEVALAINSDPSRKMGAGVVTAGVMAALGVTSLAGGLDWVLDRGIYRYDTVNVNGGLFVFSAEWPAVIEQIAGCFGAAGSVDVDMVNITPALDPIVTDPTPPILYENFPIDSVSAIANLQFVLRNVSLRVMPGQALRVMIPGGGITPANGLIEVVARYESRGSFL